MSSTLAWVNDRHRETRRTRAARRAVQRAEFPVIRLWDARATFTSGEVAQRSGATLRRLNWWCKKGLLRPRTAGHARQWTAKQVLEISLMVHLRDKGLWLGDTQRILSRFSKLYENQRNPDCYLITDGRGVCAESDKTRVLSIVSGSMRGCHVVAILDVLRQCGLEGYC